MMNDAQEWGDFSEWLNRIHESMECECPEPIAVRSGAALSSSPLRRFLKSLHQWVKQVESAPLTTWKEELEVRGFRFAHDKASPDVTVTRQLWQLLHALGGMGITLTNTDHLSDRELYALLIEEVLARPVAQIADGIHRSLVLDIVGLQMQDDPIPWLRFYASNRERMEWAKQNPGKGLPVPEATPFARDSLLPGQ